MPSTRSQPLLSITEGCHSGECSLNTDFEGGRPLVMAIDNEHDYHDEPTPQSHGGQ
jgi:hypothetical protein